MISATPIHRIGMLGSPNTKTPSVKVPTAPIEVHTAYAVPIGTSLREYHRNRPLNAMLIPAITKPVIFIFGKSASLSPSGQPISHRPAISSEIQ